MVVPLVSGASSATPIRFTVRRVASSSGSQVEPQLELVSSDITQDSADAIVSPSDERLSGVGLVHLAVQRVGGPGLVAACRAELARRPGGFQAGEAVLTRGFNLPARYVIHTVPPLYSVDPRRAGAVLDRCYTNSLKLARIYACRSVAFPAVATGVYGYPIQEAAAIAMQVVHRELLAEPIPTVVRFVLFGPSMLDVYLREARRVFAEER